MSRCPDIDEQMSQKSDEQMSDEQVLHNPWASYLWLWLFLISNHRFLCERSKKENKNCGWWLFDHLNPLLSTGSGACEKVEGYQCDNNDEGQKVEETKGIRRGTPYLGKITRYFIEIRPYVLCS